MHSKLLHIVIHTNWVSHDIVEPDNYGGEEACTFMYGLPKSHSRKGQWGDIKCNARSVFSASETLVPICEKYCEDKGTFQRITSSRKNFIIDLVLLRSLFL